MKYDPYLKNIKCAVFDIEATGLSGRKNSLVCASFLDQSTKELTQIFCDDPRDEDIFCKKLLEELSSYEAVITYNGDSYDIPFVQQRLKKYDKDDTFPELFRVDIYRLLKKYWPAAKEMKSLAQGCVEEALGIKEKRTDKIHGAECVELYAKYLETGSEEAKEKILLHNADDVRQLSRIADALSFLPYHQIAFERGFIVPGIKDTAVSCCSITGNKLHCEGKTAAGSIPADIYNDSYHYSYDTLSGEFFLDLSLSSSPDGSFIDLDDLPVKTEDFKAYTGFRNGFLILAEENIPDHKACCGLVTALLSKLV